MSTLSSANVTDVNLVLKERTHMRLCLNMLIFTHNLGNLLIAVIIVATTRKALNLWSRPMTSHPVSRSGVIVAFLWAVWARTCPEVHAYVTACNAACRSRTQFSVLGITVLARNGPVWTAGTCPLFHRSISRVLVLGLESRLALGFG